MAFATQRIAKAALEPLVFKVLKAHPARTAPLAASSIMGMARRLSYARMAHRPRWETAQMGRMAPTVRMELLAGTSTVTASAICRVKTRTGTVFADRKSVV